MITREDILAAASTGALLDTIASIPYDTVDQLADELAALHNEGRLDVLRVFRSDELPSADSTFFSLQHVFRLALPRIRCRVAEAAATCQVVFDKGGDDLAAGLVFDALREWLQQSRRRADEGLTLVRDDLDNQTGITLHVLVAGAAHDPEKYVEEALDLSRQPQPHIRQDALSALGRMAPKDGGSILDRITERLDEVIESPDSDHDAAIATRAALQLLDRFGEELVRVVEPLLLKACINPAPITRHAIAVGLRGGHDSYTEAMIDASFSAIQHVDGDAPGMGRRGLQLARAGERHPHNRRGGGPPRTEPGPEQPGKRVPKRLTRPEPARRIRSLRHRIRDEHLAPHQRVLGRATVEW